MFIFHLLCRSHIGKRQHKLNSEEMTQQDESVIEVHEMDECSAPVI